MLLQTSADGRSLLTLLALAAWTTFRAFKEASWCIGCVWKWDMIYLPPSYGHFQREHDDESILKGRIHLSWMVLSFKLISGGIKIINMTNVETYVRIPSVMKCSWWCGRLGPHQYTPCRSSRFCSSSRATQRIEIMRWYGPWDDTDPKDSALSWSYDVIPINFRAPDATFLLLTPNFPLAFKDRIQTRRKTKQILIMSEYLWLKLLLPIFPTCWKSQSHPLRLWWMPASVLVVVDMAKRDVKALVLGPAGEFTKVFF